MSNNLFEGAMTIDPTKDYTSDLVGAGKKFAEVKDLARSSLEKDIFIEALKKEKKELQDDLLRRQTIEDALKTLQNNNTQTNLNPNSNGSGDGSADSVALNEETIKQLIREGVTNTLETKTKEMKEQENIQLVMDTLQKTMGNDFPQKLKKIASDLGISEEFLQTVAKAQPKAFLKLVGAEEPVKETQPSLFSPTSAGVSSAGLRQSNASNLPDAEKYSYWKKVRTENPSFYHSPSAAKARFDAARKHGEAFYAN